MGQSGRPISSAEKKLVVCDSMQKYEKSNKFYTSLAEIFTTEDENALLHAAWLTFVVNEP